MPDTLPATLPANAAGNDLGTVRNRTFDEIAVGDTASFERTLSTEDIQLFAVLSGDVNPQHLDAEYAASTRFQGVIAHGMLGGALISAVLGTRLPGPGTVYRGQTLRFLAPVRIGDEVKTVVRVETIDLDRKRSQLLCWCEVAGKRVVEGEALVYVPSRAAKS